MDPDATLAEMRELLAEYQVGRVDEDQAERLFDLFEALDGWLSKAGFLPKDWQHGHR